MVPHRIIRVFLMGRRHNRVSVWEIMTPVGLYTDVVSRRKKLIAFFIAAHLTKFFMPAY
jgi:hypothetical protein